MKECVCEWLRKREKEVGKSYPKQPKLDKSGLRFLLQEKKKLVKFIAQAEECVFSLDCN